MTNEEKFVLDELSKESPMVISTAYIYAKNYVKYGTDITKAWNTAVEQAVILEKVRQQAQCEAYESLKKDYDTELKFDMLAALDKMKAEIENHCVLLKENDNRHCSYCNRVMTVREILEIVDEYKTLYCDPYDKDKQESEE